MLLDRGHGGYRRILLAAVGCLILGSHALSAQSPQRERMTHPAPSVERQDDGQSHSSGRPTEPPPIPVRIIQSSDEAAYEQARDAKTDDHAAKNLDAQVRATSAAEKQVPVSQAATILTFVGTCLLVWTLFETRKTAKAAIDGVAAADRAAAAAERANTELRHSQRAWVSHSKVITTPRVGPDGLLKNFDVAFMWINAGPTPALKSTISYSKMSVSKEYDLARLPNFDGRSSDVRATPIGPGLTALSGTLKIDKEELKVLTKNERRFMIWCKIIYFDVFFPNEERVSEVFFEATTAFNLSQIQAIATKQDVISFNPVGPLNRCT